ncbi:MAG: 5-(carboxyamino)imidazole ribonucleotide synthase [Ilumatobacteraceae bacterium]|nr:5-(carboxyamino)imidazole ribonucleotide synthase [Ilumatobacteraceae bacterium]
MASGVTGTVGVIGGGQLARMAHQAAIDLGVDLCVLTPDADAPAVRAGARHIPGSADRYEDLLRLAACCDVVTLEHELTPPELLERLAQEGHRVAPGARAASLGRDKAKARAVLAPHGVPTAPWTMASDSRELEAFGDEVGWPLVVKRPSGGYDGRGVWDLHGQEEARAAFEGIDGPLLAEARISFTHELAVMVVRGHDGETRVYPPFETVQVDGQCHEVFTPASVSADADREARRLAVAVAHLVELVGVMAVELFVTADGLLLNELAVRPHNSGHLTIEACPTSQFENHLRAVLGLPLGATDLEVPAAAMVNVVGSMDGRDPLEHLAPALAVPRARVHAYQKSARPGRKIGHITATGPTLDEARSTAARAASALSTAVPA